MKKAERTTMGGAARIIAAAQFAAFKHRDQRRKGVKGKRPSPYINHPLALADVLANEAGVGDAEVLMAAILHDTIEDTITTQAELERHFGKRVASIVAEVTDEKSQSTRLRKHLQIVHAPRLSDGAKLVKLADKICNLRDIVARPPDWEAKRKQEYFDWAKQVADGLRGVHPGLEAEFDRVYALRPLTERGTTASAKQRARTQVRAK